MSETPGADGADWLTSLTDEAREGVFVALGDGDIGLSFITIAGRR